MVLPNIAVIDLLQYRKKKARRHVLFARKKRFGKISELFCSVLS